MKQLLEKIRNLRVLVIGDVILDHYIWGDVRRISPEAPVPVVNVERHSWVAGGAANVAMNIRSLGAGVRLCGPIGRDAEGDRLGEILREAGVELPGAFIRANWPTIVKTRVLARNQQLCRLDREGAPSVYGPDGVWEDAVIREQLEGIDAVIFSDYAKGSITEGFIRRVQVMAAERKIPVALDPKPRRRLKFRGVDLLTPNRAEALELAGMEWDHHEVFPGEAVCRAIYERHAPKCLAVTLGADGMLLHEEGKLLKQIGTYAREVFDVSGAGDTVIAALTLALAAGAEFEEAAHLANTAAGIVVGKLGTATVTAEEVLGYHPV